MEMTKKINKELENYKLVEEGKESTRSLLHATTCTSSAVVLGF
jgi:hypothetical protein